MMDDATPSFYAETTTQDLMASSLICLQETHTYREAIEVLTQNRLTVLPVTNAAGNFLGFLSEKQILEAALQAGVLAGEGFCSFLDQSISYQAAPQTFPPRTPLEAIHRYLATSFERHVAIVDEAGYLRGLLTRRDFIRTLYLRLELDAEV